MATTVVGAAKPDDIEWSVVVFVVRLDTQGPAVGALPALEGPPTQRRCDGSMCSSRFEVRVVPRFLKAPPIRRSLLDIDLEFLFVSEERHSADLHATKAGEAGDQRSGLDRTPNALVQLGRGVCG